MLAATFVPSLSEKTAQTCTHIGTHTNPHTYPFTHSTILGALSAPVTLLATWPLPSQSSSSHTQTHVLRHTHLLTQTHTSTQTSHTCRCLTNSETHPLTCIFTTKMQHQPEGRQRTSQLSSSVLILKTQLYFKSEVLSSRLLRLPRAWFVFGSSVRQFYIQHFQLLTSSVWI